jgi:uncharacterized protein involved in type VI secretion and phage assembly
MVTGVVTETDLSGRVKVNFPWLGESNWARVVFPQWGTAHDAPSADVGDEVLVGFIGGDPRAPVILGGLYNGVDEPPAP